MTKSKVNIWETPLCSVCGKSEKKVLYNDMTYWEYPGKFQIVQCIKCKFVFTSPRPVLHEMEKYYETEMYFGRNVKKNDSFEDNQTREMHYGPMYDLILSKKVKGKIIDIGAGTGMLLSKFKEAGWGVDGVELTQSAVSYAKKKYGIKLRKGDFLEKRIEDKFDVVVLNGALEHLHEPSKTLLKAHTILKKKGIIAISVPNYDSLGRRMFGKNWFAWQPPRHLNHFSPTTITRILKNAGFKNVKIGHSFGIQNEYIIFQSARYMMSPKFKKKNTGGLVDPKKAFVPQFSLKKELGKAFFKIVSMSLSIIEPVIKKGEVMVVYAEK